MATSRTGTARHKRFRREVLHQGQANGVTHCPICMVQLDYQHGRTPASAEPDHIIPTSRGGTDTAENGRVICRRCNQSRGNGSGERKQRQRVAAQTRTISTLVDW